MIAADSPISLKAKAFERLTKMALVELAIESHVRIGAYVLRSGSECSLYYSGKESWGKNISNTIN